MKKKELVKVTLNMRLHNATSDMVLAPRAEVTTTGDIGGGTA